MKTYENILNAKDHLIECWGAAGVAVIRSAKQEKKEMTFDEFLSHCTMCGGNWGGMLLTGIRELFPETYEAIPDRMGCFAFSLICNTLTLCGIQFPEE